MIGAIRHHVIPLSVIPIPESGGDASSSGWRGRSRPTSDQPRKRHPRIVDPYIPSLGTAENTTVKVYDRRCTPVLLDTNRVGRFVDIYA
jgi:hypothetical protein